jgi:Fibronectin type III domain
MNILNRGIFLALLAAVNLVGCGGGSGNISSTNPADPTNVAASAVSATQINLGWTAASGVMGYNIYGAPSGVPIIPPAHKLNSTPIPSNLTTYHHVGLESSTLYNYIVTAINSSGESLGLKTSATTALGAPTLLAASSVSPSQINLTWVAAKAATGYNIYRSSAKGVVISAANKINATPVNKLAFSDTAGLVATTTYYYTVTSLAGTVESVLSSNEVSATTYTGNAAQYFNKTAVGNTWTFLTTTYSISTPATGTPTSTLTDDTAVSNVTASNVGVISLSTTITHTIFGNPNSSSTANPTFSKEKIDDTGWVSSSDDFTTTIVNLPANFSVGTTWVVEPLNKITGVAATIGTIKAFNASINVPAGSFTDCLIFQYQRGGEVTKYYASPTAGRVIATSNDSISVSGGITKTVTISGELMPGFIAFP